MGLHTHLYLSIYGSFSHLWHLYMSHFGIYAITCTSIYVLFAYMKTQILPSTSIYMSLFHIRIIIYFHICSYMSPFLCTDHHILPYISIYESYVFIFVHTWIHIWTYLSIYDHFSPGN